MSTVIFQCTSCEADFEYDIAQLIDRPIIKCSNCGIRPSAKRVESLAHALEDLVAALASIRSKVRVEVNIESDILPPPFGPADDNDVSNLSRLVDEEDDVVDGDGFDDGGDEDEDEDDDFDDEDDDFDDDDDFDEDDDDDDDF